MNVLIQNLPPNVTEIEVMEALQEHGVPVQQLKLTYEGNPDRGTTIVTLDSNAAGAKVLAKMVNGRLWKGRRLEAMVMREFTGEGLNE